MTELAPAGADPVPPPATLSRIVFDGPKGPLLKALAEARKHYKDLSAVGKLGFEDKRGNKRVHEYAPLDVIIEALDPGWQAVGLAVFQHCDGDFMHTMVGVGDSMMTLSTVCPAWDSCQDLGGVETYLRRYQLKSIFCVADTEDDDGASAPKGRGEPLGRKQPSAPQSKGPSIPEDLRVEVTAAAKANELSQAEFYALVQKQVGKPWVECSEDDARKVLAVLKGDK